VMRTPSAVSRIRGPAARVLRPAKRVPLALTSRVHLYPNYNTTLPVAKTIYFLPWCYRSAYGSAMNKGLRLRCGHRAMVIAHRHITRLVDRSNGRAA
jgi:hypothetical protein